MTTMTHEVIIVTSIILDKLEVAHRIAREIFGYSTTALYFSKMNGVTSFAVMPSGFEAGSSGAEYMAEQRALYLSRLRQAPFSYPDGSNALRWVMVKFGESDEESHPEPVITDWNKSSELLDDSLLEPRMEY